MAKKRTKHTYKDSFIKKEDANFYYILGAFLTDGAIYYNKSKRGYRAYLTSKDKSWLESINKYFADTNLIYKNRECFALTICSKAIVEKFISKGIIQNKSLIVNFPKVPKKYMPDFLRGCIDGDGTIGIFSSGRGYKYPECRLCSSSYDFIIKFKELLDNKGFKNSFRKFEACKKIVFGRETNTHDHYVVSIRSVPDCQKFIKWLYHKNIIYFLDRKKEAADKILLMKKKPPHSTKLTKKSVIAIYKKYHNEYATQKFLATKYGVSRSCIKSIVTDKSWILVTGKIKLKGDKR